jgi:hypothetical protein
MDFEMDEIVYSTASTAQDPLFQANMAEVTHNDIPAMLASLRIICGGKCSLTQVFLPRSSQATASITG